MLRKVQLHHIMYHGGTFFFYLRKIILQHLNEVNVFQLEAKVFFTLGFIVLNFFNKVMSALPVTKDDYAQGFVCLFVCLILAVLLNNYLLIVLKRLIRKRCYYLSLLLLLPLWLSLSQYYHYFYHTVDTLFFKSKQRKIPLN